MREEDFLIDECDAEECNVSSKESLSSVADL
jgi:hypothetical protein